MRYIAISEFKATCLSLLEEVRTSGEPIVVTKRGVPVAQIEPVSDARPTRRQLGGLRGTVRIQGDLVAPISNPRDWEALS